jgi:hypothetical protein
MLEFLRLESHPREARVRSFFRAAVFLRIVAVAPGFSGSDPTQRD